MKFNFKKGLQYINSKLAGAKAECDYSEEGNNLEKLAVEEIKNIISEIEDLERKRTKYIITSLSIAGISFLSVIPSIYLTLNRNHNYKYLVFSLTGLGLASLSSMLYHTYTDSHRIKRGNVCRYILKEKQEQKGIEYRIS